MKICIASVSRSGSYYIRKWVASQFHNSFSADYGHMGLEFFKRQCQTQHAVVKIEDNSGFPPAYFQDIWDKKILLLRDPLNTFASRIKWGDSRQTMNVEKLLSLKNAWKKYARYCLGSPKKNEFFVLYNKFTNNIKLRKKLFDFIEGDNYADDIGEVIHSSFATNTTELRYREINDCDFKLLSVVFEDHEMLDLAKHLFGIAYEIR